jgi:hypothetical protein
MQPVEAEKYVKEMKIPRSMKVIKRYAKIYNWYVQHYDKWPDKELCLQEAVKKFELSMNTIKKAINTCKYILATVDE